MIIAEQKRKENIIEYIIYIRQVQDIIRLAKFDISKIDELIIQKFTVSEKIKGKIKNWYSDLIILMKEEKCETEGDFKFINKLISDIENLSKELFHTEEALKHTELYRWAKPNIDEFRKLSNSPESSDTKVCIDALHSLLLLRIKKQAISDETMQAMQTFSNLLAHLALIFRERDM